MSKFLKRASNLATVLITGKRITRGAGYRMELPCEFDTRKYPTKFRDFRGTGPRGLQLQYEVHVTALSLMKLLLADLTCTSDHSQCHGIMMSHV